MNKLEAYFRAERGRAANLAKLTEASPAFLWAIARGDRPCPPKLAVRIEAGSDREVCRQDLLPNDWREIWPELAPAVAMARPGEELQHG